MPAVGVEKFTGFSSATFRFLRDLKANNNREWFAEHKPQYKLHVVGPALAFVTDLGRRLGKIHPDFIYDTRTNGGGSMFRIYRDTRFSKDKTPYKTHVGIFFWLGVVPAKMGNPGVYIHLDADGAQFHSGHYQFDADQLKTFRDAIGAEKKAAALQRMLVTLEKKNYEILGERYKRVPRGFDKNSEYAELACYKGLYVRAPRFRKSLVTSPKLVTECTRLARQVAKFNNWFVANLYS